jgi:1-hydroxycarotenoid 3,4-desaturase
MNTPRVVVVGGGIGGLVAALLLASRGIEVVVLERADTPGGKMREVEIGGARLDAGPTVFTMRWVFDEIFTAAGATLDSHLVLQKSDLLARHAWSVYERLDLFADRQRSADAIAAFAGPKEARGYLDFCARAQRVYQTLLDSFIRAPKPSIFSLIRGAGVRGLADLAGISPFSTLWQVLGEFFQDPRLRQLFGRYATYCGSSPFHAPATLMLVAHVEQEGVWLVEGGMHRVAAALAGLAAKLGATFSYDAEVAEINLASGGVDAVTLRTGERIEASAVVVNADVAAIAAGDFGSAVIGAVPPTATADRSLSAITFAVRAQADGFPLTRHNVFFSRDYAAEFEDLISHRRLPTDPTVYVCAQGRADASEQAAPRTPEPLFCLVNAPSNGDTQPYSQAEIDICKQRIIARLERCGLILREQAQPIVTTPADFHRMFPTTGGALYGLASHGWMASFRRPGARTRIPGLYLAGGSTHPGPGVPMAALSGRLAAVTLLADLDLTRGSRRMATLGGTSTV